MIYLCKVFFYNIVSHLSSIQLGIESCTNHRHDIIYTAKPILVSQQIPTKTSNRLMEHITFKQRCHHIVLTSSYFLLQMLFWALNMHLVLKLPLCFLYKCQAAVLKQYKMLIVTYLYACCVSSQSLRESTQYAKEYSHGSAEVDQCQKGQD